MPLPSLAANLRNAARRLALILITASVVTAMLVALAAQPAHALVGDAFANQLTSTATAECPSLPSGCGATSLANGQTLSVTYNEVPVVSSAFSLSLTDGTNQGSINSSNATATVASTTVTYTLTAPPVMQTGTQLSLTALEVLAATGVVAQANGSPWNLVLSGEVNKNGTVCTPVHQRVFGGTNCSIGFGAAGPTAPDIYDVIAVPTADLPGPSMDNAPEVITNCQAGSVDTVYPVTGGAPLGQQACGTYPAGESSIGNTTSNTLNYIPTPGLASFEPVAVVEQRPGSLYLSASGIPPQLTSIAVSGSQATFNYTTPVVCQTTPGDAATISQFTYSSPWWSTSRSSLNYPTAIACPGDNATTAITLTYPGPVPTTGVRFKFEGYGSPHFIVGAPGGPLGGLREASQSAYVGASSTPPNPTITAFSGPTTALTASGGQATVSLATSNATQCSITAAPASGVQISIPYTPAPANPPAESTVPCPAATEPATVTVPANTTSQPQTYALTLTASGLTGSVPASQTLSITVPAAGAPPPTVTAVSPVAGPTGGGTSVIITGANFLGASAVKFGSTNATSFTVNSATSITARSPSRSAGTVDMTVATASGTSATSPADKFTYQATPTVTAVSPVAGPTGGGTSVIITGTNFLGASAVKFGSTNATSFTVNSATSITAISPAGSVGTVRVTVTTASGTSAPSLASSFTFGP